jgi:CheY-like chemotaxis protein
LSPKAFAAGVEIAWWAAQDIPKLMSDDGRLRQILFNLAGNALKFVSEGGVTLSAQMRRGGRGKAKIRFAVADTGPGLAPEDRAAVFEDFVQTEAGVRAGGAGLGLAIVKRLADAFGGSVGVEANPGGGALFWFEAEFTICGRAGAQKPLSGLSIAVVSPSAIVRTAAARQIEASGGLALLAADMKSCPDGAALVLVDGALKRVRPPKSLRAIILLAPEERRRIGRARAAGFAGYLVKPLRRESLTARVLTTLEAGRPSTSGPAAPNGERVAWDERAAPAATSGARILLVEDNPVNALLARALLTREGCAVDRAASAAEALEAAANGPYDLILMDLRLPDFDGRQAATLLRRRGLLTPIVALTANSFEDDRQACLAAGMDDFLSKPLMPQALRAVLHRWVSRLERRGEPGSRTAA